MSVNRLLELMTVIQRGEEESAVHALSGSAASTKFVAEWRRELGGYMAEFTTLLNDAFAKDASRQYKDIQQECSKRMSEMRELFVHAQMSWRIVDISKNQDQYRAFLKEIDVEVASFFMFIKLKVIPVLKSIASQSS